MAAPNTAHLQAQLAEFQMLADQNAAERDEAMRQLMCYAKDLGGALHERDSAIARIAAENEQFDDLARTGASPDATAYLPRGKPELRYLHRTIIALSRERNELLQSLRRARVDTMLRLSAAAELKDDDTGQHIERIGHLSALLAYALGQDDGFCQDLLYASRMHDIGKIGIPDSILKKPGALDGDESRIMRQHPEIGAKLLSPSDNPLLDMAAEVALCHHERFDGTGYPHGLRGKDIPLSARIVAIIDVFDALTMDRCYRPAFSDKEALQMIDEQRAKHFDPEVVDVFLSISDRLIRAREAINRGARVFPSFAYAGIEERASGGAPVNQERVTRLAALIDDGKFSVNPAIVADRLIESLKQTISANKRKP